MVFCLNNCLSNGEFVKFRYDSIYLFTFYSILIVFIFYLIDFILIDLILIGLISIALIIIDLIDLGDKGDPEADGREGKPSI